MQAKLSDRFSSPKQLADSENAFVFSVFCAVRKATLILKLPKVTGDDFPYGVVANEIDMACQLKGRPHLVQIVCFFVPAPEEKDSTSVWANLPSRLENGLCGLFEECANGNLEQWLKKTPHPPPHPDLLKWFRQAAAGVAEMHAAGVIHNDIALRNIFLDRDNNIMIGDFGLAKYLGPAGTSKSNTKHHSQGMAPEQVDGKEYSYPADIWALGVVFLRLMTGRLPTENKLGQVTNDDVHDAKQRAVLFDISKAQSAELFSIVAAMLESDERKRPTAAQLLQRLNPVLPKPPVDRGEVKQRLQRITAQIEHRMLEEGKIGEDARAWAAEFEPKLHRGLQLKPDDPYLPDKAIVRLYTTDLQGRRFYLRVSPTVPLTSDPSNASMIAFKGPARAGTKFGWHDWRAWIVERPPELIFDVGGLHNGQLLRTAGASLALCGWSHFRVMPPPSDRVREGAPVKLISKKNIATERVWQLELV